MNAPVDAKVDANVDVKEVVRQKYGEAARRVSRGAAGSCCGGGGGNGGGAVRASAASAMGQCDPITSNLYDAAQAADVPAAAMLASLGCGNPTALAELEEGETVLDLGQRRRHRRAALGAPRRPDGHGLRPGHDRPDARPGRGEQAQERPDQRSLPEGRDRAHPAAGELGGRDHLQLRDQPLGRQGPGAARGLPRARPAGALRSPTSCARRGAGPSIRRTWSCGSAAWPVPCATASTSPSSQAAGFEAAASRSHASTRSTTPANSSPARAPTCSSPGARGGRQVRQRLRAGAQAAGGGWAGGGRCGRWRRSGHGSRSRASRCRFEFLRLRAELLWWKPGNGFQPGTGFSLT
jgi:hypothetical protein